MKINKEIYIKAGMLLLAVFALPTQSATTERVVNQTTEIVTVRYESPKSNVTRKSVTHVRDETNLTVSPPTNYTDEVVTKKDLDGSTTQKYENSKLLFSYVVPVTSEKAPQIQKKADVAEDEDNEDIIVDEEEEEEERGNLEEEEDEEKGQNVESEEEEEEEEERKPYRREEEEQEDEEERKPYRREEEEEEEEEEKRPYHRQEEDEEEESRPYHQREEDNPYYRREDFIGRNTDDDSDEEHYEAEEEEEEDHGRTSDEVSTEKGSSHPSSNQWRHGHQRPILDFTTLQPFSDPRPVSYSSIVYDPDGRSKTELSGSFYKKPLKVAPESDVFQGGKEHVSENTKTVHVTTAPGIHERSVQTPREEARHEETEEDEDYIEPETVAITTVKPKTTPISIPKHNFNWEEEEEEDYIEPEAVTSNLHYKIQDATTVKPKTTQKSIPRHNFNYEEHEYVEPEAVTSNLHYKVHDVTTVKPKTPKPKQKFNLKEDEHYATVTSKVTTVKPKTTAKPVPRHNFNWEEDEEGDYIEPEAVTSNLRYKVQDTTTVKPKTTPKRWEEEEEEEYTAPRPVTSKLVQETTTLKPIPKHKFNWEEEEEEENYAEPEAVTSNLRYKIQDATTVKPKQRQTLKWEEEDYEEPEAVTSNVRYEKEEATTITPKRTPKQRQWEEEPITERYEYFEELPEDDKNKQKRFNEKMRQQFHDKKNTENYYEQTINTRFGSKERGTSEEDKNYESEAGDLMKPKVEEWRHETIQKNVLSEEEEPEEMTEREIPMKKDRNQLYEYLIADGQLKQRVSENMVRPVLTTPKKEEVVQTEATPPPPPSPPPSPSEPPKTTTTKPRIAKPQRYSFGTITNPESDRFMTFNNGHTDDDQYNKIVNNIQSLFTPTTRRPTHNYEQHFLPSHGNCNHQLPDSINYESFIKPSHTYAEEAAEEEEEEEEMPRRLPVKTYMVQKRPLPMKEMQQHRPKPSAIKVTVQPMSYREAKPVMYRNAVYLGAPNQIYRKVVYYTPKEHGKKHHYSPTNHILRVVRPSPKKMLPSSRMLIIRKIEQTPP